jgi:phenylalanyl-tRNA synthetase beta chain
MKVSQQWLHEWVDTGLAAHELAARITLAGLEVGSIETAAPAFDHVVVAEVLSMEPHPNADRLRVCQVNVGKVTPLQIVCGASNVRPGLRIPAALVGAKLPGGLEIKAAKLRGVDSFGMLCSAKELGIAESSNGLWELPEDAPVGVMIRDYLAFDDVVLEVELTPNRGDCLSVQGLARDVSAQLNLPMQALEVTPVVPQCDDRFPVKISASEGCPRYLGRVIKAVRNNVATPLWMQERLRRAGLRSLGPVVDVTNYVLLELGQPMHAFDLAKLRGGIDVRWANAGEQIALLNEQTLTLRGDSLVIADDSGAIALAGIMGGSATAVTESTTDLFLEAAFFAPLKLAGKARHYSLQTDSSYRFERGVDPTQTRRAMERATALIVAMVGGVPGPIIEISTDALPKSSVIVLRRERITRVLGTALPDTEIEAILSRLGCRLSANAAGWQVEVPSHRFDVALEVDLIEELARVVGYAKLPKRHYKGAHVMPALSEQRVSVMMLRKTLVDRGYYEAITYSFVDPETEATLGDGSAIPVANPISRELSVMRSTLWSGLVNALRYNVNRQQTRVRLFEVGRTFKAVGNDFRQLPTLAGVVYGDVMAEQWGSASRAADFFDVKGDVEALLALCGSHADDFSFRRGDHGCLHPGQTATIFRQDEAVGVLGKIRPDIARTLDVDANVYLFEITLSALLDAGVPRFKGVSKYPSIRRDLAFVVEKAVESQAVLAAIRDVGGGLLQEADVFDVYAGKELPASSQSMAVKLVLQDHQRTLQDVEVDALVARVVDTLKTHFKAQLRE